MGVGEIADDDDLFRHSVFPVAYRKNSFASEKLLHLKDQGDGTVCASLAWGKYLPTVATVHDYGCRMAARRNDRSRTNGSYKEKSRATYCGAYQITGRAIRELSSGINGVASSDVFHRVEDGEIAHIDFMLIITDGHLAEGTKTAIIDRFWNSCRGPLKHTCVEDSDLDPHPNSSLAIPPLGEVRIDLQG